MFSAIALRGLTVGDIGAVIKGESQAFLKNQRGVTMQLETRVTGLRFNISASGIQIVLAGAKGCPVSHAPKH